MNTKSDNTDNVRKRVEKTLRKQQRVTALYEAQRYRQAKRKVVAS